MPLTLNTKQIQFGHAKVEVKLPEDAVYSDLGVIKSDEEVIISPEKEVEVFEGGTPRRAIKVVTAFQGVDVEIPISYINEQTLRLFFGNAIIDKVSQPGKIILGYGDDGHLEEYAFRLTFTRPEDGKQMVIDLHKVQVRELESISFGQDFRVLNFKGTCLVDDTKPDGQKLMTITLDEEVVS